MKETYGDIDFKRMTFPQLMGYYSEIPRIRKEKAYPTVRVASQMIANNFNQHGGKKPDPEAVTLEPHYMYTWSETASMFFRDLLPNAVIEAINTIPVVVDHLKNVKPSTANAVIEAFNKNLIPGPFFAEFISLDFMALASIAERENHD